MAKKKVKSHRTYTKFAIFIVLLASFGLLFYILRQYGDCLHLSLKLCLTSKIYENKELGYSFRYPNYFPLSKPTQVWEIKQAQELGYVDIIDFSSEFYFNAGGERLGGISVSKSSAKDLDDLKIKYLEPRKIYSTRSNKEILVPTPQVTNVSIGNDINALMIGDSNYANFEGSGLSYTFINNGLKYGIGFSYDEYYHKLDKKSYEDGYELILSTFRVR